MELKHVAVIALSTAACLALGGCASDLKKAQVRLLRDAGVQAVLLSGT